MGRIERIWKGTPSMVIECRTSDLKTLSGNFPRFSNWWQGDRGEMMIQRSISAGGILINISVTLLPNILHSAGGNSKYFQYLVRGTRQPYSRVVQVSVSWWRKNKTGTGLLSVLLVRCQSVKQWPNLFKSVKLHVPSFSQKKHFETTFYYKAILATFFSGVVNDKHGLGYGAIQQHSKRFDICSLQ